MFPIRSTQAELEGDKAMLKTLLHEAAALASLTLFVGMVAIWAQVFASL